MRTARFRGPGGRGYGPGGMDLGYGLEAMVWGLWSWGRVMVRRHYPPRYGQTDTCENITLPQLCLRAVINQWWI